MTTVQLLRGPEAPFERIQASLGEGYKSVAFVMTKVPKLVYERNGEMAMASLCNSRLGSGLEGEVKEILPVIVAGIEAYRRSFKARNIEKRVFYKEKVEKLSLWRVGGRNMR